MFVNDPNGMRFADLDEETRQKLANFLHDRAAYQMKSAEISTLRAKAIMTSDPKLHEDVETMASTVLTPMRESLNEPMFDLIKASVDVDGILEMLPMLLMVITQNVDLDLLLTAMGIEPDTVTKIMSEVTGFIGSNMPDFG